MKKIYMFILAAVMVAGCNNDNDSTMYVKAKIKGLKKGTFYLQKQKDSLIISVDSVSVNGKDEFMMTDVVESPEMYYLTLGKSAKRIAFFGEKDTINISSQLDRFSDKAVIKGSANQDLLNDFNAVQKRFNDQRLDLIKQEFEAHKTGSQDSVDMVADKFKRWQRKKYLYTTNFAVNNADFEVSPYIALTELTDANVTLLDTINNSMNDKVKTSKYGVQLSDFVKKVKAQE